jgi:hypothetical protein
MSFGAINGDGGRTGEDNDDTGFELVEGSMATALLLLLVLLLLLLIQLLALGKLPTGTVEHGNILLTFLSPPVEHGNMLLTFLSPPFPLILFPLPLPPSPPCPIEMFAD